MKWPVSVNILTKCENFFSFSLALAVSVFGGLIFVHTLMGISDKCEHYFLFHLAQFLGQNVSVYDKINETPMSFSCVST